MNFEQAVSKALTFAKKSGYPFVRLVSADRRVNRDWVVKVDVGAYQKQIRTVVISDTGVILGFK
jgi:hypothetical protein